MEILQAVILGILQGLTEWLPVSSSGHLMLAKHVFGIAPSMAFDIALHAGTLIAVFAFFWDDIWKVLNSMLRLDFKSPDGRMGVYIIVASIPTGLAGYFLYEIIEYLFSFPKMVGFALLFTSVMLYTTKYSKPFRKLRARESFYVGMAQAFGLIPGISRSGATISIAKHFGIDNRTAFKFSFLLAIPAVIGANAYIFYKNSYSVLLTIDPVTAVVGIVVAAIAGYLSLKVLKEMILKGKFYVFSYYCLIVGTLALIL